MQVSGVVKTIIRSDYFIVEHDEHTLTRSTLERGYAILSELCVNHKFQYAICDLSRIEKSELLEVDFMHIRDAMVYVFTESAENFKLFIVDSNNLVSEHIQACHRYMGGLGVVVKAQIVADVDAALAEIALNS